MVVRLAAISPRLKIEWITGALRPYWGLKVRWADGDPRWEHVRAGRMAEAQAFDLEQMFPPDCSALDMAAYVEQRWGEQHRTTGAEAAREAERIASDTARAQQAQKADNIDRVVESSTERSARESSHAKRVRAGAESAHPMVPGGLSR